MKQQNKYRSINIKLKDYDKLKALAYIQDESMTEILNKAISIYEQSQLTN